MAKEFLVCDEANDEQHQLALGEGKALEKVLHERTRKEADVGKREKTVEAVAVEIMAPLALSLWFKPGIHPGSYSFQVHLNLKELNYI